MGKKKSRGGVNKSEVVRKYLGEHPDKPPREVAADLTAQGVAVSAAYVSNIKSGSKLKKKTRRVGRPRKTAAPTNNMTDAVANLIRAKKLADELGGIQKAKEAMDALARLSG